MLLRAGVLALLIGCRGPGAEHVDGSPGTGADALVAIVPPAPSTAPCNADPSHLHLQVQISGAVYDVAVNDPRDKRES